MFPDLHPDNCTDADLTEQEIFNLIDKLKYGDKK
jgi:hypothetical protein